ncbi:hypothetical protein [Pseudoclavibacter sp. 13-3]|uniref:hypothetical protein n=1 Tax=Pseudoclavibacter sp. 13-3 TaxID=2901228 RepID=UPI001E59CAB3|nr:hypothetical protein [Pseudoclavibacter sp. 13-3]MCD7100548.1 hypothetical protein [Pseudoclavibacter sp. 13-3]
MESHQSTADQGLASAVAAQADLASAQASLASAQSAQQSAQAEYSQQNRVFQQWGSAPAGQVPAGLSVPSGSVVRSLYRQQQDAAGRVGSASTQVGDAQSRLDAARRLVASAKQSYQEDAHTTAGRLQAATDSAIPADSWWEKLTNSDAWKVLVTVATVVVVVAAVAGLFLSGPAGWIAAGIAFGAGALLTADDIAEYAKGNMSTGQFLLAMGLNFIPGGAIAKGGKALAKGVGAIARGAGRVASASGRVGQVATHAADAVVSGSKKAWSAAQRAGDRVSAASQRAWDGAKRSVRSDPIYQGVLASGKRAIDNVTDLVARASGRPSLAHAGADAERSTSRITGDLHDGAHTRQATTPDTGTGTSTGAGRHSASGGSDAGSPAGHDGTHSSPRGDTLHGDMPRGDTPQAGTPDPAHAPAAPDTPHAGDAPAARSEKPENTSAHSDTDGHGDTPGDSGSTSGDGTSDGGPGDSTGRRGGDGPGGDEPGGSGGVGGSVPGDGGSSRQSVEWGQMGMSAVSNGAFGAVGNTGVYLATTDQQDWSVQGAAAAAAGGAVAGAAGAQGGHLAKPLQDKSEFVKDFVEYGVPAAAEVAGGLVQAGLDDSDDPYTVQQGLLDALGGAALAKFPGAEDLASGVPSFGAHVAAAYAGEHAGLGVDAIKYVIDQVAQKDVSPDPEPAPAPPPPSEEGAPGDPQ